MAIPANETTSEFWTRKVLEHESARGQRKEELEARIRHLVESAACVVDSYTRMENHAEIDLDVLRLKKAIREYGGE